MLKILIIEDEIQFLHNLASYLSSFKDDFEVLTAASGEDGLVVLEGQPGIDLLLTDVRLPGIDGIEVVRRTVENWPAVKIVVMTAFGSAELRSTAESEGAIKFVEKPVDLAALPKILREAHAQGQRRSRAVGGLTILDVTQFLALARESKVIQFKTECGEGSLVFENGVLVHCTSGKLKGVDSFYEMALWGEGSFSELYDVETRRYRLNVDMATSDLLAEATRLSQEVADDGPFDLDPNPEPVATSGPGPKMPSIPAAGSRAVPAPTTIPARESTTTPEVAKESRVMAIKDHLAQLEDVEGFKGAAVFTAQGEMLEGVAKAGLDIKATGMYANNALLNAQKATDQMGVGRGNMMQIRAPQAVVLMRCLNEATDFSATKGGKAHFHSVVVMDPEGNIGMATMVLDRIQDKIADELR